MYKILNLSIQIIVRFIYFYLTFCIPVACQNLNQLKKIILDECIDVRQMELHFLYIKVIPPYYIHKNVVILHIFKPLCSTPQQLKNNNISSKQSMNYSRDLKHIIYII